MTFLREFKRTYNEIERIIREKAEREAKADEAFERRFTETQSRIDSLRNEMKKW